MCLRTSNVSYAKSEAVIRESGGASGEVFARSTASTPTARNTTAEIALIQVSGVIDVAIIADRSPVATSPVVRE